MRLGAFALLLLPIHLLGQDRTVFEVASIHLHQGVVRQTGRFIEGPRITVDAMTVTELAMDAYEVRDFQIDGGPGWLRTDRYDIGALAQAKQHPPWLMFGRWSKPCSPIASNSSSIALLARCQFMR